MTSSTPQQNGPLDVKEIVSAVDSASSLLAYAAETFADIMTIFEALNALMASNTLAGRLARLGEGLCAERITDFQQYRDDYNELTHRFMEAVDVGAEVRNG